MIIQVLRLMRFEWFKLRKRCPGYCSASLLSSRDSVYGATTSRTTRTTILNQDLPPKIRSTVRLSPLYDETRMATLWSLTVRPSHISKMVLPTVQLGPPNYAIRRTEVGRIPHSRLGLHNKTTIAMKMEPVTKGCVDTLAGGQ